MGGDSVHAADARAFIAEVRKLQEENPKSMKGRSGITDRQWESIRATVASHVEAHRQEQSVPEEAMINMLEYFEKLCKRHQREVPEYFRSHILDSLIRELLENQ